MTKNGKKLISVVLGLSMLSSLPVMASEEPITITTVVSLDDAMQQMQGVASDVLTNNSWYNGYLADLGIQVENVWSVPSAQYEEKLNAQIAAYDLPDVFACNEDQLKTLVENEMIMDMTAIYEEYASDFTKEMVEADGGAAFTQSTFAGKLMALPNISGNHDAVPIMWIRRDWMEKLGYEAPTTLEELEALAMAFVTEDPDGDGVDDTFGIALSNDLYGNGLCDMTGILEMFGAHNGWLEVDGKAEFGLIQPEVKTALSKMAEWYQNGILDQEFLAMDSSKVSEDIIAGNVGISFGQHWTAFWPYPDAKNMNAEADWYPYAIPTATGALAQVMVGASATMFYVVSAECEHPEAVMEMYNYYYQKDCALSEDYDSTYHITSSLQMEHPEQAYNWAAVKTFYPQQNLYIYRGVKAYLEGDKTQLENSWVADNAAQVEGYLEDPVENQAYYASYIWSGPEGAFSVVDSYEQNDQRLMNAWVKGNTDAMSAYNVTLDQLILESFTKIITGEKEADSFEEYVEQWKTLGGDEITAEVNAELGW